MWFGCAVIFIANIEGRAIYGCAKAGLFMTETADNGDRDEQG